MMDDPASYPSTYFFPFCNEITKYEKLLKIGQGTFGEVHKAIDKKNTNKAVALKKVLIENEAEGFPITALREIKLLQQLRHKNIVNLLEICYENAGSNATNNNTIEYKNDGFGKSIFYLVFEFCEHDLAGLLSNPSVKFSLGEIKDVIQQLLNGLYYIHNNNIIHRDIKAANVLITKDGVLKLADFGLARAISIKKENQKRYTNKVVTLWYRPPELLLGSRHYGPEIDLWGMGCVMAEMWKRSPIMQGSTDQHQLKEITRVCGEITPEVWPSVTQLEQYNQLETNQPTLQGTKHGRQLRKILSPYVRDEHALDLIDNMLQLDPSKRLNADQALDHDFFYEDPMPCSIAPMLSNYNHSMFEFLLPRKGASRKPPGNGKEGQAEGYNEMIY